MKLQNTNKRKQKIEENRMTDTERDRQTDRQTARTCTARAMETVGTVTPAGATI